MYLLAYYQLQLYIPLHGAILLLSVLSLRNQLQHYAGMIHDVPEQLFALLAKISIPGSMNPNYTMT